MKTTIVCILAALILTGLSSANAYPNNPTGKFWAVIVCGSTDFTDETDYLYEVLTTDYQFNDDNIYYLHIGTGERVDARAGVSNIRGAFTIWLKQRSTSDDTVLIYIAAHGGGYNLLELGLQLENNTILNGRIDVSGDEGEEISESVYGKDVNKDGDKNDWFGVDESMVIYPYPGVNDYKEIYWDDELADDLSQVNYWRLIFVYVGVTTVVGQEYENQQNPARHCYSGGYIDDLSAPNRIIISPTNETYPSIRKFENIYSPEGEWVGENVYDLSFWGEQFVSALDKDTDAFEEADHNNDGLVSILEAFNYAYEHDPAVQGVLHGKMKRYFYESPWLDDNGNGLPTYKNGCDVLDSCDGLLSSKTDLDNPKSPDLNRDGTVDINDIVMVISAWLTKLGDIEWNPNYDFNGDGYINIVDVVRVARWFGKNV